MMRIALGIEYDGSGFNGWQSQSHGRTVQDCVESALGLVADEVIRVHCAGRTDAGVHAAYQVVHFDTGALRRPYSWTFGANSLLDSDVNLLWAVTVSDKFHARFRAMSRSYRYVILNHPIRSSLLRRRVTWECRPLDTDAMQKAAEALIGEHDFSSFRAVGCQAKNPVRKIIHLVVRRVGNYITIDIKANAFLQHMVRNIVGVLMEIGIGKRSYGWASEVLRLRDRSSGGMTAPADGLYLVGVEYSSEFSLPTLQLQLSPLCFRG